MTKDFLSDGVLVYDRYYCKKPNTPLLVIKRILLTAAYSVCSMMFILSQYGFPVSLPVMAAVCGVSCAAFSALFVFVKKSFALPGIFCVSGLIVLLTFEKLTEKLAYFADSFLLLMEGRFVDPRNLLFHQNEPLNSFNSDFIEGTILGTVLMCILYSLIVSACLSGRIVLIPPLLIFVGLCVPVLLSENLEFSFWLIPALAALAGLIAICGNYASGLAVNHGGTRDYRQRMRREEKSFLKNISKSPLIKRTEMRCNYYSKYFSTGMFCAALVSVCLLIGASIFPKGSKLDYTSVYEFFSKLGSSAQGTSSPFEEGTAAEYFTHSNDEKQEMLNIISPGQGNKEIIRVSYTGNRPVYLRGDIGIDFNGSSWTTVVGSEPDSWVNSELKDAYRPCEGRVIAEMISAKGGGSAWYKETYGEDIITSSDISIEYLCDTDVVFLPPYTADYSFYDNSSFDVYGDFAVRVSEEAGSHINTVECTALLPSYMNNETHPGGVEGLAAVENMFLNAWITPDDIYSSVIPEMNHSGILSSYEDFVERTYIDVPADYSRDIRRFIDTSLSDVIAETEEHRQMYGLTDAQYRYITAEAIAEYLRENYTYSLYTHAGSNPVIDFLETTKRGHCALYASAMTLILRELGIPSRYCTGFYVESDNGSNTVVLKERNLHAWVEVYTGQFGWVTFDPTSSSVYPGRGNPGTDTDEASTEQSAAELSSEEEPTSDLDTADTEKDRTIQPEQSAEQSENSSGEGSDPEEHKPSFFAVIAPFLPIAAAVILLAAIAALIISRLNKLKKSAGKALSMLKSGNSTESARKILRLTLRLLEYRGITPKNGEMPRSFWHRADEAFGTYLEKCDDILEAMEFGRHEVSEENRSVLFAQLERIIDVIKPFGFPGNVHVLRIIKNCSKKSGKL